MAGIKPHRTRKHLLPGTRAQDLTVRSPKSLQLPTKRIIFHWNLHQYTLLYVKIIRLLDPGNVKLHTGKVFESKQEMYIPDK